MARRTVAGPFPYSYGLSSSYNSGPVEYHHEREPQRESMNDSMRSSSMRDDSMRDSMSGRSDDYRSSSAYSELSNIRDDPQGKKLYSTLERLNSNTTGEGASDEIMRLFPPPPKRYCPTNEKPVYKNGHCIPRQDALLVEMIMNDKATLKAQLDVTKQAIVGNVNLRFQLLFFWLT